MIYILAGDVRSGKTSALQEWVDTWDTVKGIICPDGHDNLRYLYNIETQEKHSFQRLKEEDNTVSVGKFHFLEDTFKLANYTLIRYGGNKCAAVWKI